MRARGEVVTDLVNSRQVEEIPEDAVSDRSHLISDQMAVSMAISLKRIADALTGPDWTMISGQIETIAWNAGRSFESGRRP